MIIAETRDSGCHESIQLVKSVSKQYLSDNIIIKTDPKSFFILNLIENPSARAGFT